MTRVTLVLACLLTGCVAEQSPCLGVPKPAPAHVPDSGELVEYVPCDAGLDCVAVRVTPKEMRK